MKEEVGTYACQSEECKVELPPKPIGCLNVPYISQHIAVFSEIS